MKAYPEKKISVSQIVKELQGAFVLRLDYLERDSQEIRSQIQRRMAETNCKRILAMLPVFLGLGLLQMFTLFFKRHQDGYYLIQTITLSVMAGVLIVSAVIVWLLYLNQIENEKELWKYKIIYRLFWLFWTLGMAASAVYRLIIGHGGFYYIAVCVICCLIPLYSTGEFLTILVAMLVLANGSLYVIDQYNQEIEITLYTYMAMLIIGFVAQRFQVRLWTMKEYVYMKAFQDPLTGLLNRRGGNALMAQEMKRRRGRADQGIVMLDVDFFKKYNDTWGHEAGDFCLKEIAECLREAVSERTRLLIRHGGEEFVAIFFDATGEEMRELAERIRSNVYARGIPTPYPAVADVVTVSVGAAFIPDGQDECYENCLRAADQALYEAKESGRNRVVCREPV